MRPPKRLDRLWAGWRSEYVVEASAGGNQRGEGSVFTRILESGRSDEETYIVHRGRAVFAILNAYPYGTGHLLVMPYRMVSDLEGLDDVESAELWSTINDAVRAVRDAYRPDGVNVGFNLGDAAGAGVPDHVHAHVLPRWAADSNFMTALAETRVLPEPMSKTWAKLRAAWPTGEVSR